MKDYFYVYILSNKRNNVVYIGVSSNLIQRVWQHKEKLVEGFTKRYNVDKLVYYEQLQSAEEGIQREKQMKNYSRNKKITLIESMNPTWEDLYERIL